MAYLNESGLRTLWQKILAKTNATLTNANSYTDTKISDLINNAPTTLDTLGEIAIAMADKADIEHTHTSDEIGTLSMVYKEKEVYCYPMENSILQVTSYIEPIYSSASKNLLSTSRWSTTWNGISYTCHSDGSLSVNGTATAESSFALIPQSAPLVLKKGIYTFSTGVTLTEGTSIYVDAYEDAANWIGYSGENSFTLMNGDAGIFSASGEHEYVFTLKVAAGHYVNLTLYPQVEAGEYATGYETYTSSSGTAQATTSMTLTIANDIESQQYTVTFGRNIYNGTYNWNEGKLIDLDSGTEYSYTPNTINALAGLNSIKANTGIIEVNTLIDNTLNIEMQEYNHMSQLRLYGETATITKDNAVMLRFKYYGADNYINDSFDAGLRENGIQRGGWVKVKWQGSSSTAFPKKNYSLTFYWDDESEKERALQFKTNWGAHSKYCAKANFIDQTHSRNVVAAKLWGECVRSRNTESESYIRMNALPNAGAIDGYPMFIFINDKYQGVYTMNIPKEDWTFGMTNGEGTNTVLCAEDYSLSAQFYGAPVIDGTDWDYEVEPANKSWVLNSFSAIYNAIAMPETNESEVIAKRTALEACVDIYSVIDYDIFINTLGLSDNNGKNQLMATYDGTKWIISAYDLDTAFGNHWSGAKYQSLDTETDYYNGLTLAVRSLYAEEYAIREVELKNGCLSKTNIIDKLMNFAIDIPQEALWVEAKLWPDMCGANENDMQQIVSFLMLADSDSEVNSRPITTTGNGSAYIAAVPGITSLTPGISFIMLPHVVSASTSPTLNVNNLGAKTIRRRLSSIATDVQAGYTSTWLAANLPFRVTYDGTQWIVEGQNKPVAADLYGTLTVTKGGTGATDAATARTNLGITPANIGAAVYTPIAYTEIDNISASGIYRTTGTPGLLIHMNWDVNYAYQILNLHSNNNSLIGRYKHSDGNWSAWTELNIGTWTTLWSGTLTVGNTATLSSAASNYKMLCVEINGTKTDVIPWDGQNVHAGFSRKAINYNNEVAEIVADLQFSGTTATLDYCYSFSHQANGSHSSMDTENVTAIYGYR